MRLCSFRGPDGPVAGLVEGDVVVPLAVADAIDVIRGADPVPAGDAVPLSSVVLEAPVVPGNAFGIGLNYRAHAAETGKEPPEEPVVRMRSWAPSATRTPWSRTRRTMRASGVTGSEGRDGGPHPAPLSASTVNV